MDVPDGDNSCTYRTQVDGDRMMSKDSCYYSGDQGVPSGVMPSTSTTSSITPSEGTHRDDTVNIIASRLEDCDLRRDSPVDYCEDLQRNKDEGVPLSLEDKVYKVPVANALKVAFSQDEDGDTDAHITIAQGAEQAALHIIDLVSDQCDLLNMKNNLQQTPLHLAALTGQSHVVRRLIQAGALVDVRDRIGNTALHLAVREGHMSCVTALLQPISMDLSGPHRLQRIPQDPELRNYYGQTVVHIAASLRRMDMLKHLTNPRYLRANINAPDSYRGRTVLHHAAEAGDVTLVSWLVTHPDTDLFALTAEGDTALEVARAHRHHDVTRVLKRALRDRGLSDSEDESVESDLVYDDIVINGEHVPMTFSV